MALEFPVLYGEPSTGSEGYKAKSRCAAVSSMPGNISVLTYSSNWASVLHDSSVYLGRTGSEEGDTRNVPRRQSKPSPFVIRIARDERYIRNLARDNAQLGRLDYEVSVDPWSPRSGLWIVVERGLRPVHSDAQVLELRIVAEAVQGVFGIGAADEFDEGVVFGLTGGDGW